MSLLLNMLFRLVITFLPRSRHLLISWLQSCVSLEFYNWRDNLEYTGKKAVTKRHSSQNYRYLSSQRKKKKGQNIMICWTTSSDPIWKNCNCTFRQGDNEDTESRSWEFLEIWRWLKSESGKRKVEAKNEEEKLMLLFLSRHRVGHHLLKIRLQYLNNLTPS